ncbi:unnamed protein product [Tuber melanosporum]|uniref:(Perigord truffle) hypothetical protein n=1 Tax=Tuber melanosporum (strain Mel28) TaxID=656061 RepID=D5G837_TUBMM|nr:uncharacterized protein GSTUM_00002794001 [Tuber melanosporum]CAZ80680.1 unnamed protein product [Tuber melanosporum]
MNEAWRLVELCLQRVGEGTNQVASNLKPVPVRGKLTTSKEVSPGVVVYR